MGSLTIKVSAKAEAMIATLQKEIFNRRRKKVTAVGVVETLVESGAKSQSDKRYAASWKNLIKDIEKASAEEWAMLVAHRTRKGAAAKKAVPKKRVAKKAAPKKAAAKNTVAKKAVVKKAAAKNTVARRAKRATKAVAAK